MGEKEYRALERFWKEHPRAGKAAAAGILFCTRFCYVLYPGLLLFLFCRRDERLLSCFLVPAVSFVLLSAFRRWMKAPRPYEKWEIHPLIRKNSRGDSFPSRHVFSCFMIAMTFLWICRPLGVFLLVLGLGLAVLRVAAGVHFLRDVIAGAAIGIACGLPFFFL